MLGGNTSAEQELVKMKESFNNNEQKLLRMKTNSVNLEE